MIELTYTYKKGEDLKMLRSKCMVTAPNNEYCEDKKSFEESFFIDAVWDTGATSSSISKGLVDYLGLKPTGIKERISGANGIYESDVYEVDFYLTEDVVFRDVSVSEMPHDTRLLFLIGLDIILQTDFSVHSTKHLATLKVRYKK